MHSVRYRSRKSAFIVLLSLVGASAVGFCAFVLLEAMLPGTQASNEGAVLFRFQLSSMIAMGVFAGLAIVIYVRLSRSWPNGEPGSPESSAGRNRQRLRK
jgi:hypothetical protein